jgi:hypothetical protein
MQEIHVQKVIESETLYLPELRSFLGQTVDIIVRPCPSAWLPDFWKHISKGWQGGPLVRPEQGDCDSRDALQ